jgi:hypothetical protein
MMGRFTSITSSARRLCGALHVYELAARRHHFQFDLGDKSGIYSFMVGERLLVKAEGAGASMDELKAATAAVDAGRLAALVQK